MRIKPSILREGGWQGCCLYLDDAAPARSCPRCFQQDGVGIRRAAGEDDAAAPAARRPRWNVVRCSVAAQPSVSTSIPLGHVDEQREVEAEEEESSVWKQEELKIKPAE